MSDPGKAVPILRRAIPFLTIALVAAVAYDGWVFYSRWSSARHAQVAEQEKESADARKTLAMLGGGGLKVLSFYASPGIIRHGDHASLCYGVVGAEKVRMEPAIEELHPALSYCMQVSPVKDTEYKLIAQDRAGHTATGTAMIRVAR